MRNVPSAVALSVAFLLLAFPAQAQTIEAKCPNGLLFVGELSRCPCCESCPEGSWIVEGEACPEAATLEEAAEETPMGIMEVIEESGGGTEMLLSLLLFLGALMGYLLPWLNARMRKHPQRSAIGLLNLFLGWTVLGWIVALIWSATAIENKER